jgi:DNA-binding NarL/FixJ family response regulator/tRNA A-37 threonylcarbamoyl transferase component Bud32
MPIPEMNSGNDDMQTQLQPACGSNIESGSHSKVSVVIIEDHDLVRLSVKLSLENSGQIKVVGEARTGTAGVELAKSCDAQVVIMDLGLPEMDGIEATRQIKQNTSKKVVILTSHIDDRSVISALEAGADGFLLKDTKTEDLLLALYSVAHGASWLEDSIVRSVADQMFPRLPHTEHNLSDQELRILVMAKAGMSTQEIAHELCLPLVRVHDMITAILRRAATNQLTKSQNILPGGMPDNQFEIAMICTRCRARVDNRLLCPDDGADLVADPLIGTQVTDRYLLLALLGTGGNGAVYKARHRYTEKIVAVKILHADLAQSSDLVARFRQEAVAIASLDHANLVSVIDFGMTGDGTFFMVMDYLDGKSLVSILRESGPMDYKQALPIFIEVCEGVAAAHEAGIIHRDLKPGNVHILNQGQKGSKVKVLDFGLAKVTGDNNIVMTVPGEIFGSPAFMSPEQCRGMRLDMRSDIYSMGCLMYQILTGETVFQAQSAPEVMYHQIYTQAESFERVNPGVKCPQLLVSIVLKCLEKDPNNRFQSMLALKQALSMCTG